MEGWKKTNVPGIPTMSPKMQQELCIHYVINAHYILAKEDPLSFPHHRGGNCVLDKENNNDFVDAYLMFSKARQWPEGGV